MFNFGKSHWLVFAILMFLSARAADAIEVYVSPTGAPGASGTKEDPLGDLEQALEKVRERGAAGSTIFLFGGIYSLEDTVVLDGTVSGSEEQPLRIAAVPGQRARFIGGPVLEADRFRPVGEEDGAYYRLPKAARSRVLVYQLEGAAVEGASGIAHRGYFERSTGYVELFSGNDVLEIAAWPNAGIWKRETRLENGYFIGASRSSANSMTVDRRAPLERWADKSGAWLHGYFANDWADEHLPLDSVDLDDWRITSGEAPSAALGENRPFRIYNLPEELSTPGEYWIDSDSGLLYVWPVKSFASKPAYVSTLTGPLFRVQEAANIVFTGVTFEASRGNLVEVTDSSSIAFEFCTFRYSGTDALVLHGTQHLVSGCEFYGIGAAAIDLDGGDFLTLSDGGIVVTDSYFKDTGRHYLTNSAAVVIRGVGNVVRNNLMTRLPHTAIEFSGNNHLIELNDIVGVCYYSDDAGAIYAGRDWSGWGTVIRRNLIREIRSSRGNANWVAGIYLDDCASGTEITENVIYGIEAVGLNIGGGRNNVMQHNIIAATGFAAHANDNRGLKWATDGNNDSWNLLEQLRRANAWSRTWANEYPEIAETPANWDSIRDSIWLTPHNSVFSHNVGWSNKRFAYEKDWVGKPDWVFGVYRQFGDNKTDHRAIFNSTKLRSRTTRPKVQVADMEGFPEIDLSKVGPRVEYSADAMGLVAFTAGTFLNGLDVMADPDSLVDSSDEVSEGDLDDASHASQAKVPTPFGSPSTDDTF